MIHHPGGEKYLCSSRYAAQLLNTLALVFKFNDVTICNSVMPEPGEPGGPQDPPIFGRLVNPIPTGEGRLFPPITTGTPNVFHLPASVFNR